MIAEPATGLFHQVGAGKTLEMVVGAHEMRRMGLVRKPAAIVPNHMLEQFTREWLQAYPSTHPGRLQQ
ncbi:DEAD/DEAH box helicase [Ruania zhangjianzhongii]|uniref:DEAD/DEAH box helicase n=1 Tax=Ruania zhangjianzhongii TaxID=2603206 RepID=UPI0011CC7BF0|nr:DEAD/DEAH box helicase [Ruania zhangjianzhongii]